MSFLLAELLLFPSIHLYKNRQPAFVLIDGAKIRRFFGWGNRTVVAFWLPRLWYSNELWVFSDFQTSLILIGLTVMSLLL